jgi:HrpA-like RNA helicase
MEEFEPGEMVRIPLDSVILMLKEMLKEERVTDVLLECLEPPNLSAIDKSFSSLHRSNFITTPDDDCAITFLGAFVSALGIDLALGSVVGLGIQFGVAAEAVQMAAILSSPKTPFIISNPLVHDDRDFNGTLCSNGLHFFVL